MLDIAIVLDSSHLIQNLSRSTQCQETTSTTVSSMPPHHVLVLIAKACAQLIAASSLSTKSDCSDSMHIRHFLNDLVSIGLGGRFVGD
jgi:tRNA A37 threonylcarbamoyladenosine synthetase subunit TsaC/SUA5/YrdC